MAEQPFAVGDLPQIASIEFPAVVKNDKKALQMVGGAAKVSEALKRKDQPLKLRLRPDDPLDHPVSSGSHCCPNIVLEIELPRDILDKSAGNVKRALEIAGDRARVAPRWVAGHNFRFREMADFQYFSGRSPMVNLLEKSIMAGDLNEIDRIDLNQSPAEVLPPPRFSLQSQPFFYNYKQNPSVSIIDDGSGAPKVVNRAPRPRLISSILVWGDSVPGGPPSELEPQPRPLVQKCIEEISKLFEKRPSYTRRALEALTGPESRRYIRYALPYVAYFYRSGPWRGAYIRYGHDPSQDRALAQFQVEHFRIAGEDADKRPSSEDDGEPAEFANELFQFDGVTLPASPMLQLCDISDQFLVKYIASDELRETVDGNDGWYRAGTMAVIRKVLRAELAAARDGRGPVETETLRALAEEAQRSAVN